MEHRTASRWTWIQRALALSASVWLLAGASQAKEATSFGWAHEGYASLGRAAAEAKRGGKRLLVGLSGSET